MSAPAARQQGASEMFFISLLRQSWGGFGCLLGMDELLQRCLMFA